MKRLVKNNVHWVGKVDWELKKFHGDDYSINNGSSQNAYLIQEEKTVLITGVGPHARSWDNLRRRSTRRSTSSSSTTARWTTAGSHT